MNIYLDNNRSSIQFNIFIHFIRFNILLHFDRFNIHTHNRFEKHIWLRYI